MPRFLLPWRQAGMSQIVSVCSVGLLEERRHGAKSQPTYRGHEHKQGIILPVVKICGLFVATAALLRLG